MCLLIYAWKDDDEEDLGLPWSELEMLSNVEFFIFWIALLPSCPRLSSRMSACGPMTDSTTGSRTSPWVTPKTTIEKRHVKTVRRMVLVLKASGITPKNVESPPRRIDDPIVSSVSFTLPSLVLNWDSWYLKMPQIRNLFEIFCSVQRTQNTLPQQNVPQEIHNQPNGYHKTDISDGIDM